MITKDSIEAAYCFFHQKRRIYIHSNMDWQKDDIEYAIAQYVEGMNAELYATLATGNTEYLISHSNFEHDLADAERQLEQIMSSF